MANKEALDKKKQLVKDIIERFNNSVVGVFVDYRGITVEQDTDLRRKFRDANVNYNVIRNRMAKFE